MSADRLHYEVLIAGFGGQGVVLAGRLLADAALAEGREVVWAPSYGPEMRGGAVHCTVVVASQRIGSPEVSLADSLLIMDRPSLDRFAHRVKPGGLFVLNSTLVQARPEDDTCEVLAVAATQARGTTVVRDAVELRVKETDRIATVATELQALGARIEPLPDGFVVEGPTPLRGGVVDSHGDHRLAMALAVAGLVAEGEVVIEHAECIADSFPGFVELMRSLGAVIFI